LRRGFLGTSAESFLPNLVKAAADLAFADDARLIASPRSIG
jgi:hypothetical protein